MLAKSAADIPAALHTPIRMLPSFLPPELPVNSFYYAMHMKHLATELTS